MPALLRSPRAPTAPSRASEPMWTVPLRSTYGVEKKPKFWGNSDCQQFFFVSTSKARTPLRREEVDGEVILPLQERPSSLLLQLDWTEGESWCDESLDNWFATTAFAQNFCLYALQSFMAGFFSTVHLIKDKECKSHSLPHLTHTCMCTCEKKQELSRQETARHLMYFFLFEIASSRQLSDPKSCL